MTKGRTRGRQSGEFASGARNRSDAAEGAAPEPHASVSPGDAATELLPDTPIGTPRTPKDFEPLVTTQGSGRLDFSAMLAIADVLPVMIGYVAYADGDFVLQFVNKPFAEWLERPRAELIGRRVVDIVGAERLKDREPLYRRALAGERIFYVSEYDHPSFGPSALQSNYVPWAGEDGAVHGFIVVHQDVTEQRTAERALKESEARFRRIANQAPVLMWVTRLDRIRDFVNDAYMEFLGTEDREFARTYDWRSGIHPDDVERIIQESIAGEASMQAFTLEGRFRGGDGEYRWLKSTSSPRFGPDGEHIGFIGAATDITLTKEAELELRRLVEERTAQLTASEAQFRAVFEAALEVMVLLKPDGTVLAVNNRREAWRHDDPSEAIGQKIWDAPTLRNYPQHKTAMKRGIATAAKGKVFTAEIKMEREGTATAYLDVSVQPVRTGDGSILYLLFEARDITELKAAQEQLRQSQKMEALGQLTGGIAHDFNNLLTVVVGGLDIITKRAVEPKLKRYAENALTAAERGARLTGQLLAFSRVQRLEVRPTYVAPLIENMRPLLRNVLGPGITKQFDLDTAMMPVMADPTQLEVAVLNLAINARDAMPDGGVLSFSSRPVRVTGEADLDPGDYIELTIADTGEGMPPEVLDRAFEPFFTTKEVGKGTGLGLSMVYGMARQSGGAARIESATGKGTAVKLLLRKADESVSEPAANVDEPQAAASPIARRSILVVDDDPDVRGFIVEALEEQGYLVREAAGGKEGIAEVDREVPDLIVLDFIMPGLSGADVARHARERRPDQPILFVSGYSETEAVKRTAPDAPLLAKPFRAEALHRAVRAALTPAG